MTGFVQRGSKVSVRLKEGVAFAHQGDDMLEVVLGQVEGPRGTVRDGRFDVVSGLRRDLAKMVCVIRDGGATVTRATVTYLNGTNQTVGVSDVRIVEPAGEPVQMVFSFSDPLSMPPKVQEIAFDVTMLGRFDCFQDTYNLVCDRYGPCQDKDGGKLTCGIDGRRRCLQQRCVDASTSKETDLRNCTADESVLAPPCFATDRCAKRFVWSECSASCGKGQKTYEAECFHSDTGERVPDKLCHGVTSQLPRVTATCEVAPCSSVNLYVALGAVLAAVGVGVGAFLFVRRARGRANPAINQVSP